jgi:hypothetical protein
MLALIFAAALNSTIATHVEDVFLTTIYVVQAERAERARLANWVDEQDVVRVQAIERLAVIGRQLDSLDATASPNKVYAPKVSPFEPDAKVSPFADDGKPDPFEQPPRLFWWNTVETKPERW